MNIQKFFTVPNFVIMAIFIICVIAIFQEPPTPPSKQESELMTQINSAPQKSLLVGSDKNGNKVVLCVSGRDNYTPLLSKTALHNTRMYATIETLRTFSITKVIVLPSNNSTQEDINEYNAYAGIFLQQ